MPAQDKDDLITEIETKTGTVETAVLWGFLGDEVDGFQQLYSDLTRERWVEIDVNDIKMSKQISETGGSLVWVIRDTAVKRVAWVPPSNLDVAYTFVGGGFLAPSPDPYPGPGGGDGPPGPPKSTVKYRC
jgi:hypothetical protein